MRLRRRNLKQKATLTRRTGIDEFGKALYGEPEVINCRWESVASLTVDVDGEEFVTQGLVYVGVEVATGDRLESHDTGDVGEVKAMRRSVSLDGRQVLIKAFLTKFRGRWRDSGEG